MVDEMWSNGLDPAVITTTAVAAGRQPVLRVVHEEGHGGWQVYDDVEPLTAPVIMLKEEILKIDPTIAQVTDLPVGYEAYRSDPSFEWPTRRIMQS